MSKTARFSRSSRENRVAQVRGGPLHCCRRTVPTFSAHDLTVGRVWLRTPALRNYPTAASVHHSLPQSHHIPLTFE
eukprot:2837090-Prymnesium_polylepis.1